MAGISFRCGRCAACRASRPSGYYAYRSRGASRRALECYWPSKIEQMWPLTLENEAFAQEITGIHPDGGGTSGAPRVHAGAMAEIG